MPPQITLSFACLSIWVCASALGDESRIRDLQAQELFDKLHLGTTQVIEGQIETLNDRAAVLETLGRSEEAVITREIATSFRQDMERIRHGARKRFDETQPWQGGNTFSLMSQAATQFAALGEELRKLTRHLVTLDPNQNPREWAKGLIERNQVQTELTLLAAETVHQAYRNNEHVYQEHIRHPNYQEMPKRIADEWAQEILPGSLIFAVAAAYLLKALNPGDPLIANFHNASLWLAGGLVSARVLIQIIQPILVRARIRREEVHVSQTVPEQALQGFIAMTGIDEFGLLDGTGRHWVQILEAWVARHLESVRDCSYWLTPLAQSVALPEQVISPASETASPSRDKP